MNYRELGRTGWKVSEISFGAWAIGGGWGRVDDNESLAALHRAIDLGVKYITGLRAGDGGFGYNAPGSPGLARTGTALLCLELCGKHGDKATIGAGEWVLKHLPGKVGGGYFYYALYYCSQGMFQLGGKYWELWARNMSELMLNYQAKDGSWPA